MSNIKWELKHFAPLCNLAWQINLITVNTLNWMPFRNWNVLFLLYNSKLPLILNNLSHYKVIPSPGYPFFFTEVSMTKKTKKQKRSLLVSLERNLTLYMSENLKL